ncbi:MAG: dihydroorotase family protein [Candidatus Micrarchaeota archaeon]
MSLAIKGGNVFLGESFAKKDLLIEEGRIVSIGNAIKGDETLEAKDMLVLPGLIDPHVHLREPGATYKEDFATGSRAAIAGGFTTVMDMPNNPTPTITKEALDEKRALAKKKAICDVLFHFGGTDDNFDEIKRADPGSLKLYLGRTTGPLLLKNPSSLKKHLENFRKDRPVVLHACDHSSDEAKNLKTTYETMENAVALASKTGNRMHIAHASTKKEITIARKCPHCTVEVAPHHLFLSTRDRERLGPFASVFPPLRSEQKRLMLWSALQLADCIATDHAPHTIEDKEQGAAGFPGLETSLALMLTACRRGLLDKIWVAQRMTRNPADIFHLKGKGRLEIGNIADIAIVDPKKVWKVDGSQQETKCKWSPFDGMELTGKVHTTIKGGKLIYHKFGMII